MCVCVQEMIMDDSWSAVGKNITVTFSGIPYVNFFFLDTNLNKFVTIQ